MAMDREAWKRVAEEDKTYEELYRRERFRIGVRWQWTEKLGRELLRKTKRMKNFTAERTRRHESPFKVCLWLLCA